MLTLSEAYNKSVQEEMTMTQEQLKTRHVGKQDPKRHLENAVETAMGDQVGFLLFLGAAPLRHYRHPFFISLICLLLVYGARRVP